MDKCKFCGATDISLKKCCCNKISYCSQICQKNDWKNHKRYCPPFTIAPVTGRGKGLVATRKIKFGETVLVENPILVIENGGHNSLETWVNSVINSVKTLNQEEQDKLTDLADNEYFNKTPEFLYLRGVKQMRLEVKYPISSIAAT